VSGSLSAHSFFIFSNKMASSRLCPDFSAKKARMPPKSSHLNAAPRIFWVFVNLALGILPSFAFFAWIERNAALPWIAVEWGWPWVGFQAWPIAGLAVWDFSLFLLFGILHSFFAQPRAHRLLQTIFPPQALRTVYLSITGLSLIALMGLWQNTGVVIWSTRLPITWTYAISMFLFWSFMAACGWFMNRFDPLQFIGLKQIYMATPELTRTSGTPQLETTGIYGRVRHPIYTFTLLAILVTPVMTLDRLLIALAMGAYLFAAIPVEERKLIAIFGPAYDEYRKRVPAVVPKLTA
jgi:hypothetical protein